MQWECLNIERIFNFSSSGANLLGITVSNERKKKGYAYARIKIEKNACV